MFLIIVLFALAMAAPGLFSLPPLDRDEARYAQASAQMLETGDFVAIRFQVAERNKKPAGAYWLQAASVSLFSDVKARDIWAYRLPSAIAAVAVAVMTALIGAHLFGRGTGLIAGLLIAAAPLMAGEATIAKTDALLVAAIVAAQGALAVILLRARAAPRQLLWPCLFWIALAVGILIKGPIAPLISALTIGAFVARRRSLAPIRALRPLLGGAILVLLVAPWGVGVWRATEGRFFAEALGGDMAAKLGAVQETHGGPPGYHLALLPLLFWPAMALLPRTVVAAWRDRTNDSVFFLIAWIAPFWIILELTATKLPHYALPVYPAIALLAARSLADERPDRFADRAGAIVFAIIGLAAAGLFVILPLQYGGASGAARAALFFSALVALASIAGGGAFLAGRRRAGVLIAITGSFLLAAGLLEGVLPRLEKLQVSPRVAAAIDAAGLSALSDDAGPSTLAGYSEPSAIFLLGTETRLLPVESAATLEGALASGARPHAVVIDILAAPKDFTPDRAPLAVIDGVNYSNGRTVSLAVFAAGGAQVSED